MPMPLQRHMCEHRGGSDYMLHLIWAELEYDVKHALWRRGKVASIAGDQTKITVLTDDDTDFLLRSFSASVSDLREKLVPYVYDESRMASDELMDAPDEYNMSLRFDDDWRGSARVLCDAAHAYVCDVALRDILTLADDALAQWYDEKANKALRTVYNEANECYLSQPPIFIL